MHAVYLQKNCKKAQHINAMETSRAKKTTYISIHERSVFLCGQTPYHPLFVTASHSMLIDVTSRLVAFSLLLTPSSPSNPATNAPGFLLEVGTT